MISLLIKELRSRHTITNEQVEMLRPVLELYRELGVVSNVTAMPLHRACVCGHECWREAPKRGGLPNDDLAGISIPWVGPGFERHRVLIVAENFRGYGGLWGNWDIKEGLPGWNAGELELLRAGRKRINNSSFAYGMASYAAAVVAALEGSVKKGSVPLPDSSICARALESCGFLQGVKCSPPWTPNMRPTWAMGENCPREYLLRELGLLEPRVLIVLGGLISERLRILARTSGWQLTDHLGRGFIELDGCRVVILQCSHPSAWGYRWRDSYVELVDSLRQSPLEP